MPRIVLAVVANAKAAEHLDPVQKYLQAQSIAEKDIKRRIAYELAGATGKPAEVKKMIDTCLEQLMDVQNGTFPAMRMENTRVEVGQIGRFANTAAEVIQVAALNRLLIRPLNVSRDSSGVANAQTPTLMVTGVSGFGRLPGEKIHVRGFFRFCGKCNYGEGESFLEYERFDVKPFQLSIKAMGKKTTGPRISLSTEPEFVAAKKLRSARQDVARAKRLATQIVKRYPDTWAAEEAKKLVAKLSN